MYYRIRKKLLRFFQTIQGNDKSDFKSQWTPKYRLDYYKLYRQYVKDLKGSFEITYE